MDDLTRKDTYQTGKGSLSGPAKSKPDIAEIPDISLPKGGGAIKSIGEKYSVNPANGTASFSIPFPFSASRNGFVPGMGLNYNSGNGNGIFGLGWNAEIPSVARKTEKKLPRYNDAEESDTFVFSGADDLVPSLVKNGSGEWVKDEKISGDVRITNYKPRMEGAFAHIAKITESGGNTWWKVTSRDNVVSVLGKSKTAQLSDPANEQKIFKWFLEFCYDDKGNCFQCEYEKEDNRNIPASLHEKNRLEGTALFTNTYLKRVKYANKVHFDRNSIDFNHWDNFLSANEYLLELVLDYGDHDKDNPQPIPDRNWMCRPDPFSVFKSGFEVRTYRLCQRLLMFHHFTELGNSPCLVRSLDLEYNQGTTFTFLTAVTQKGFIRNGDGSYSSKSFPPLEFAYEPLGWNTEIKSLPADSLENLPAGIEDKAYRWVDLYGEGIAGILTEQADGWFYRSNAGDGRFDGLKPVAPKPSFGGLNSGNIHFQDVEGNGKQFLVSNEMNGFYELTPQGEWLPFKAFAGVPSIGIPDPNVKYLDLDGDGRTDILVSEEKVFRWYGSKGKEGFENYRTSRKSSGEEAGPDIVFDDITQSIVVADMTGDGLMDIVRIRNHDIVYWPNLGYGKFGPMVRMSNPPVFDQDDCFNPRFVKLADMDGSGTTDIVYLANDSFKIYFNQAGNSWSGENIIGGLNPLPFPKIDNLAAIRVIDLLGNGTGCIVWSSPLPAHAQNPVRYIDLMNGRKPYLLASFKNNMGKEVSIHYKASTAFYLEDKKAGKPWITKLPFPVYCVDELAVTDQITKTRLTNQYSYHHGYYDYEEQEFRGFGRVDQTDTEHFERYVRNADPHASTQIVDKSFFQPPVLTKTWFHTGAFPDSQSVWNGYAREYFSNEALPEKILKEPDLLPEWTAAEWREAVRSCKGLPLRTEVYSFDGSEKENYPYSTSQHTCFIRLLQPRLHNPYAVFMVGEEETLTYTYDRNPPDPLISHQLTLETDDFGNTVKAAAINYGRNAADNSLTAAEQAEQNKTSILFTVNSFTSVIDNGEDYRLPALYETKTFELTGLSPDDGKFFITGEVKNDFDNCAVIAYRALPTPGTPEKRLLSHARTVFFKNDLSGPLPLGEAESFLLPYQSYRLVLTSDMITQTYGTKVTDDLLTTEARYFKGEDGNYWITSAVSTFDAAHFYQVTEVTDPFGFRTSIAYDTNYYFFARQITDALQNTTLVKGFNFRTLTPFLVQDANDNRSAIRQDELGMVQSTFAMARENETKGDLPDILSAEASPDDHPTQMMEYDLLSYANNGKPLVMKTLVRETHYFESLQSGIPSVWQTSYAYADGSGNVVMKKVQAEPGIALQENNDGTVVEVDTTPELRWIGNGRTVLNNKGKPVMQYEPYFSVTFDFEDAGNLVERGVTPVIFYDPVGRVMKTDMPDGTFSKTEFDPWKQVMYDRNDTVLDSQWYSDRITAPVPDIATPEETDAAAKAAAHANTPSVSYLDALGRNFLSVADNGADGKYKTLTETDIQGNVRVITDARGNSVVEYTYDMTGNILYQKSMDSGERWILNNVSGNILRSWDNRNHEFAFAYDALHRSVSKSIFGGDGPLPLNNVYEKLIYGESLPDSKTNNLREKPAIVYDTAGRTEISLCDFKGNILNSSRRFTSRYKEVPDWSVPDPDSALDAETFSSSAAYDALNRITRQQSPDSTIYEPSYDEGGLLEKVMITQNGTIQEFVKNISYNEKGRRERIIYGNDVSTGYSYDKRTFRLVRLETRRITNDPLQDLNYTFDPAGNITRIEDRNIPVVFFNNQQITGTADYTYDALYRLTQAKGREHAGQLAFGSEDNWNDLPFVKRYSPGDAMNWRNYTQQYRYDAAGNILQMAHVAGTGSWTRDYTPDAFSNRLMSASVGSNNYVYAHHPQHGFITALPHLQFMQWNFREELQAVARQNVNSGIPETTWYVYDDSGQRVRKITERQASAGSEPTRKTERIYIGDTEIYREYDNSNTITLERTTYHVKDDSGRIAIIETRTAGTDDSPARLIRYQFGNHIGSSCMETDEAARVISYEEYHPFGTTAYQANDAALKAAAKRYRFTAMERDEESGLEYHTARYYMPWLGSWLSADPIGINGGINLYAYSLDNPVNLTDTNGRDTAYERSVKEKKEVADFYETIDQNNDKHITLKELTEGFQCTTLSYSTWWAYADTTRGNYTFDPEVEKLMERPSLSPEREYELNETTLRYNEEGEVYTNREGREATRRELNKYSDPQRVIGMTKVAAAVLAPEYYFPASSIWHSAHGDPKSAAVDLFWGMIARYGGPSSSSASSSSAGTVPYSASIEWEPYTPTITKEREVFAGTSKGDIMINPTIGQQRELQVAEEVNGRVAKIKGEDVRVSTPNGEKVTVDVLGPNGELIIVGGPAKSIGNLGNLGYNLKRLKEAADALNVPAMAYFTEDTMGEAIRLAWKWLGKDNVRYFKP